MPRLSALLVLALCGPAHAQSPTHVWLKPAKGRSDGVCRTASGGTGLLLDTVEWAARDPLATEEACAWRCGENDLCLAYEFDSVRDYSTCELHADPITDVAPRPGAACKVKGAAIGGARTASPVAAGASLETCLRASIGKVYVPGDNVFDAAKNCRNRRDDITKIAPVAVARVRSAREVQAAVRCVDALGIDTCARAGAHGFEDDACCPGGLIIDVRDLEDFSVETSTKIASFGSGHTNGQLYYKLSKHGLVFPGGTEGGVGQSGLTLGCGRGMLTQIHGLACDSVVGIEYVDAKGALRMATRDSHQDMLWMSKGAGGNFPGIVTKWIMQVYDMPSSVFIKSCHFGPWEGKKLLKVWSRMLPEFVKSERKMFTHVTSFANPGHWSFESMCFSCDGGDRWKFHQLVDTVVNEVGGGGCHTREYDGPGGPWLQKLLAEPGVGGGEIEKLAERDEWPTNHGNSKNGAVMVPTQDISDAALDALLERVHGNPPTDYAYQMMIFIYPMGGDKVTRVGLQDTAYGGRNNKWVIHWREFHAYKPEVRAHSDSLSRVLEGHLGCRGFYNYIDTDMPCTRGSRDKWLRAVHSDVDRMRAIKASVDPTDVFRSRLPEGLPGPDPVINCNTPTCTAAVLGTRVDGYSCEGRMAHLRGGPNGKMPMRALAACNIVASQFDACKPCKPPGLPAQRQMRRALAELSVNVTVNDFVEPQAPRLRD